MIDHTSGLSPRLEDYLRVSLQIAIDLISCAEHRVYLRFSDKPRDDGIFKFVEGYIPMPEWTGDRSYDGLFDQVMSGHPTANDMHLSAPGPSCIVPFQLDAGPAGLFILRRNHGDQEFTDTDKRHLELIAYVLTVASAGDPHAARRAGQLVRRLQLAFFAIHDFSEQLMLVLNETPVQPYGIAKQVLSQYTTQARQLFWGTVTDSAANHSSEFHPRARSAARLVLADNTIPDKRALWTAVYEARRFPNVDCTEEDWTLERVQKRFLLTDKDSISASVFNQLEAYSTNSYHANGWPCYKLFPDTKSLIIAPIISGNSPCLGVMTFESTENEEFGTLEEAAFSLLSAHATDLVAEALHREELFRRKEGDALVESVRGHMLKLATWDDICASTRDGLKQLGFHRGFFAEVKYDRSPKVIIGNTQWTWGDTLMTEVARLTVRPFDRYANDCQVLAATEVRHIIIQSPIGHPNVDDAALMEGRLQPFGIFPLVDVHGRVQWTLHVEREDAAPIAEYEVHLVSRLCAAAMESWEAAHNRTLERQWLERIIGYSARTVPSARTQGDLLQDFLNFLHENGVVERGRIFSDLNGVQTCVANFGDYPTTTEMKGYPLRNISATSQLVLAKLREKRGEPLFVVQHSSGVPASSRGEFAAFNDPEATYMAEFGKEGLSEWIEAGVYSDEEMLWKVVLDHKGRRIDRFSLNEMRLIGHMVRTLSWAITKIDSEQLRSELCIDGAVRALKRHQLRNHVDSIIRKLGKDYLLSFETTLRSTFPPWHKPGGLLPWIINKLTRGRLAEKVAKVREEAIARFASAVRQFEHGLGPFETQWWSQEPPLRLHCCSDVFRHVAQFMDGYRGSIEIRYPRWHAIDPHLGPHGLPLCLIMLILLQNSIEASHAEPYLVDVSFDDQQQLFKVRDWGRGLPDEVMHEFKQPPRVLAGKRSRGLGLVLARLLARELQWELLPTQTLTRGTEFCLCIGKRDARS